MHRKFTTCEYSLLLCKGQSKKTKTTVEYCPTHLIRSDYFTKPLQAKAFKLFCDVIMRYYHVNTLLTMDLPIKEPVEKGNKIKMIEKLTVPYIKK